MGVGSPLKKAVAGCTLACNEKKYMGVENKLMLAKEEEEGMPFYILTTQAGFMGYSYPTKGEEQLR